MLDKEIDDNSPGDFDNVRVNPSVVMKPKLTFFYERPAGDVFAAEEQESANGKYWKKFKYVGWSDGTTYLKVIKDANFKRNEVIPKEKASALLKAAFDAELVVAKQNMVDAKKYVKTIPYPHRSEWAFDRSVPLHERNNIMKGGNSTSA